MIHIMTISKIHPLCTYDKIYLPIRDIELLRSRGSRIAVKGKHAPELAPKLSLESLRQKMIRDGTWNFRGFHDEFRPRYLDQIKYDKISGNWLDRFAAESDTGINIAIACYCKDNQLCHRSIIGDLLAERGCEVVYK